MDTVAVMLPDMAAVTAVDTRHGGVHSVGHVHGGFHSVSHVGGAFRTVGHLCGFHHIAHFRRGFRGFGAYAYYDDYGCWRWFLSRWGYVRAWVC